MIIITPKRSKLLIVTVFSRARSVLAETEEPAVLKVFPGTETEPEPNFGEL